MLHVQLIYAIPRCLQSLQVMKSHLTLPIYTFALLLFPVLEHDLHGDEEACAREEHKGQPRPRCPQLAEPVLYPIDAEDKADQVGSHHHEQIQNASGGADVSIPPVVSILLDQGTLHAAASRLTFSAGQSSLATISGRMKRLMSQPHHKRFIDMSCHKATKVKTSNVARA